MAYAARIILDSINLRGERLTTMEITFPRIVLAEFNTHRSFSRNSASSRAIPIDKMLERVLNDPFIPIYWGKNQKGMQAKEELDEQAQARAVNRWCIARDLAVQNVRELQALDVHKQIANRLLEPFMWHTVIVTATEWSNFFALRCHPDAQPEIQHIARMMQSLYQHSIPTPLMPGHWHLPLTPDIDELQDFTPYERKEISVGRCARVSYLTHNQERDPQADIALCRSLAQNGHMSPFEHVATPRPGERHGNFIGWRQFRQEIPHETDFSRKEAVHGTV